MGFWGNESDLVLRKSDYVTPADNCAEGSHQRLWQLFHRAWTQSDGPSYQKSVWLDLEKEIMTLIKENRMLTLAATPPPSDRSALAPPQSSSPASPDAPG